MPITLSGSASSTTVQRNLQLHNAQQTSSIAKISSGQRVFRAEEDPAAIVSGVSMSTELASLGRARLNATNGISMLQVADGALSSLSDIASRMKALASQSSSSQLTDNERVLVNQEFQALKTEFGRIAEDTEFNDVKLLTGNPTYTQTTLPDNAANGIANVKFDRDVIGDAPAIRYAYDASTETLTVSRLDETAPTSESIDLSLLLNTVAGTGNNLGTGQTLSLNFDTIGVTLELGSTFDRATTFAPTVTDASGVDIAITSNAAAPFTPGTQSFDAATLAALNALPPSVYDATTGAMTLEINTNGAIVALGGEATLRIGVNGAAPNADGADGPDLVSGTPISSEVYIVVGGSNVLLGSLNFDDVATTGTSDGTLSFDLGAGLVTAEYEDNSGAKDLTYVVGNGISSDEDQITVTVQSATLEAMELDSVALVTAPGSNAAIQSMDNVLEKLGQLRANVGAQQSRLEFVARNVDTNIESTTSARSELLDVDITAEITELTSSQAMYEASLSMMARVNQQPQQLLELLRNS